MLRDLSSYIRAARGISPAAAVTDNTAFVSQILDTNDFDSVTFVGLFGAIADADCTFTVLVEHDDAAGFGTATAVADADLIGVEAMGLNFASDNQTFKIGYKGNKRYVRVTVTPASNSGNIFLAGIWIEGHPRTIPQTTQVV